MTKTFLITGATGGIGSVLSNHLTAKGYNVALAARNEDSLNALAKKLNGQATYHSLDFSKANSREEFINHYLNTSIAFDGLVLMPPQVLPSSECLPSEEDWMTIFHNSFVGPIMFLKEALKLLKPNIHSKVVLVSGITSVQVVSNYSMANFLRTAWLGQMKTLAHHYGPEKIHFNSLSLGGVMTEKYKDRLQGKAEQLGISFEQFMETETENIPLRKYADPQEVANSIEALLTEFSDHMTGQNIVCDGGYVKAY